MAAPNRARPGSTRYLLAVAISVVAVLAVVILPPAVLASSPRAEQPAANPAPGTLAYSPPAWPEPPDYQSVFVRLGLGTVLVLGLCVGTLWACKRWLRPAMAAASGNSRLTLVETLPLGNRCCLHLVHVADRPVLIGADASGIKTVVPLPETFAGTLVEAQAEAEPKPEVARPRP
jgi:flagellar biogenesis protein FliO